MPSKKTPPAGHQKNAGQLQPNQPRVKLPAEQRRQVILDAALRLFARKGYYATTTKELAAAAGVTEPVLYEHFQSKRELYEAIIKEKRDERLLVGTRLLQPFSDRRDDHGFFEMLAKFILEKFAEDKDYTRLFLRTALEGGQLADIFVEHINQALDLLGGYIELRMREGAFRKTNPRLAAQIFLFSVAHTGMIWTLFPGRFRLEPEVFAAELTRNFLDGIRLRSASGQSTEESL